MKRLMSFVENRLTPPLMSMASNRYLLAIRDAFTSTISIVLAGSIFLLIAYFPSDAWSAIIAPIAGKVALPSSLTLSLVALYLAFSAGYSLAKTIKLEPLINGLMSVVVFLIMCNPLIDGGISTAYMGGQGIFLALISAAIVVSIAHVFKKRGWTVSMPAGVPPIIAASFESLFSTIFTITLVWALRIMLNIDIPALLNMIFQPLAIAADSIWAVIVEAIIVMVLWFGGIHGHSIIAFNSGILSSFALSNMDANAAAVAAGESLPYVVTPSFESFFQQGSVATCALCIMMIFICKSTHCKQVGKIAAIPGLFGVTEPLWFGLPMVLNPIFLIPFVFAQVINLSLTYIVMSIGLVGKTYVGLHWALPGIFGSYLSTGGDFKALIWWLLLVVLDLVIYYPFIMIYDKQKLAEEQAETAEA